MDLADLESHTFSAQLDCRYLLRAPARLQPSSVLALALHGYGSDPASMLRLTARLIGAEHVLASLQAPYQHYNALPSSSARNVSAYNWGIRDHWREAVRLHHEMVLHVLSELRARFGLSARRTVLIGFSQPVGLNYRFLGTYPSEAGGAIALCGGVPRDWEDADYQPVEAAILHIAREQDEYYPAAVASEFAGRLRRRASDVEFHVLPGGHRFPSQADTVAQSWLTRVFPAGVT
jgi:predicted esterase